MDYYASALPVHTDDIKAQSTGSNKPAVNNEGDVLSVRATALLALVFGILVSCVLVAVCFCMKAYS